MKKDVSDKHLEKISGGSSSWQKPVKKKDSDIKTTKKPVTQVKKTLLIQGKK